MLHQWLQAVAICLLIANRSAMSERSVIDRSPTDRRLVTDHSATKDVLQLVSCLVSLGVNLCSSSWNIAGSILR